MSEIIPIQLIDSDDEDNNNNNLTTPLQNNLKRTHLIISCNSPIILDDDPTPPKLHKSTSSSSTISFVPETPFSFFSNPNDPPVIRCTANVPKPPSSGDHALVFVGSDDESGGLEKGPYLETAGACAASDVGNNLERISKCAVEEKQLENKEIVPGADFDIERWLDFDSACFLPKRVESDVNVDGKGGLGKRILLKDAGSLADKIVEEDLDKREKVGAKDNCQENGSSSASFDAWLLETGPPIVQSTCHHGNRSSTKTNDHSLEDDSLMHLVEEHDHEKENIILEKGGAINKPIGGDKANGEKKQKDKQAANRKKMMEEKKLKKEQEKAEAAKAKQREKETKKLEKYKFSEKDIVVEIDPKVLSGSLGGPLLTMFNEKHLTYTITPNPIEKTIIWRMLFPEGTSQLSAGKTDIHYILLIYDDAEEFCNHVNAECLLDHISSVQKRYPSYTICCLTNRLMSFINKREQQKYKKKGACEWKRPPVEEVFAKLTTQFARVHTRQCADEAEVAEHVVGLTVNLVKCQTRKKLTHLSVNANGCNVPKNYPNRGLILKHPWLKALVSIPKVQPRHAVAIWKKYPTMKSLLHVYMDPTKTVQEKESVLKDLPLEGLLGNESRLGDKCSKRVYRILMAQDGSIKTDDVEHGADFFPHSQR